MVTLIKRGSRQCAAACGDAAECERPGAHTHGTTGSRDARAHACARCNGCPNAWHDVRPVARRLAWAWRGGRDERRGRPCGGTGGLYDRYGRMQARGAAAARMRGTTSGQRRNGWHGRGVKGVTSGAGGLAVARAAQAACTTRTDGVVSVGVKPVGPHKGAQAWHAVWVRHQAVRDSQTYTSVHCWYAGL